MGIKWLLSGAYKPPLMSGELFKQDGTEGLDKISEKYEHFIFPGYLNFNILNVPKNEELKGVCDIFDLSNTVENPTCFTSRNKPSLWDVILVNHASFIGKTFNLLNLVFYNQSHI